MEAEAEAEAEASTLPFTLLNGDATLTVPATLDCGEETLIVSLGGAAAAVAGVALLAEKNPIALMLVTISPGRKSTNLLCSRATCLTVVLKSMKDSPQSAQELPRRRKLARIRGRTWEKRWHLKV